MQYSDTSTRTGIVELLEDLTETNGMSSYTIGTKTRDINLSFDDYQMLTIPSSGTWQADDANHTRYPNFKFNLTSGQQDYTFSEDEQGNQILDIYRVEMKDSNSNWVVLDPINEYMEEDAISKMEGESGVPTAYWKTANGIFLNKNPNFSQTNGMRVFYARTPSYFTTTDTTKEPGIPNGHHKYLAWKAAYYYWVPKDQTRAMNIYAEVQKMERDIKDYYSKRVRDERPRMTVKQEYNR